MKRGKAQSAVEYLVTYAWAVVAVLAIIAALFYLNVFTPGNLSPPACDFLSGPQCAQYKLNWGTAYLELKLRQNTLHEINVTKIKCTMETNTPETNWTDVGVTIPIDGEAWVASTQGLDGAPTSVCCMGLDGATCYGESDAGNWYSGKIWLQYTELDSGVNRTVSGDVAAPFE
jgi:hypothetical protein